MRNYNINTQDFENIYLFSGTEEVRGNAKIDSIIESVAPSTYSLIRYDMELSPISEVIKDAMTIPFLTDYKIIILKNPRFLTSKRQANVDYTVFLNYLKKPAESTILIINALGTEIDKSNEIYQMLQKVAYIKDTQKLDDVEYMGWVARLLPEEQVEIKSDALECLTEYVKQNYVRMENEVKKLASYVGVGGVITLDDVKELVSKDYDGNIFSFTKAIIAKDTRTVVRLYEEFRRTTQDVMGIIAIIGKTFRELLTTLKLIKTGYKQHDIATAYDISSGRAYYLMRDAKTFSEEVLAEYVRKIAKLDYEIKSGQMDKNIGLEKLIFNL